MLVQCYFFGDRMARRYPPDVHKEELFLKGRKEARDKLNATLISQVLHPSATVRCHQVTMSSRRTSNVTGINNTNANNNAHSDQQQIIAVILPKYLD